MTIGERQEPRPPIPRTRVGDLAFGARQMLLLAGLTWREGIRRRMILVGLVLTVAFVALYGTGTHFAFREFDAMQHSTYVDQESGIADVLDPTFIRNLAAYQMLSFGLFISTFLNAMLAVFLSSGMISGDAENGTLQTIITRPVARAQVLVARYLGYASVLTVYAVLLSGSILVLTRVFSGYAPPHPVQALVLLVAQGLIILGIVALGTSILPPVATGIGVLMLFGVGFIGGIVAQIGDLLQNETASSIGSVTTYVTPTDAYFRMALERLSPPSSGFGGQLLAGPFGMPADLDAGTIVFGLAYLGVCLLGATLLFRRRDL
jgi:Cu-processing system permease protein